MKKAIYINSQGGTGFNLALSSICKELKAEYETVAVLSPYFDIFESNKYVDIVYKPNELRDFIFDAKAKDARLICERMYDTEDFIYKKISYADAWRKAAGLKTHNNKNGSDTISELNPVEKYPFLSNQVEDVLKQITEKGFKDFVIMQFTGGQSPLVQVPQKDGKPDWSQVPYNYENEPLKRHYPTDLARKFVQLFSEKHPETAIVLFQLPNEPVIEGVFHFVLPYLAYYELAKRAECRGTVSIDSSLQHLVAGVTKSVVVWGHSEANSFGYEYNKNIQQDCRREDILYFSALGPSGAAIQYIKPEKLLDEVDAYLFTDAVKIEGEEK